MYSILGYCRMIADEARVEAYARALRQTVKPGAVVLEIGTGLGLFALLAAQCGARKVYAVEPDEVIRLAREVAAANGYAERIEFIQDFSTKITLPEPADVILSDLRGVLPPYQNQIHSIVDARARLLAPGGVLIPQRDDLFVAVVEGEALYRSYAQPWGNNAQQLDWQPVKRVTANTWGKAHVPCERILLEPQSWASLDYTTVTAPDLSGEAKWTVSQAGVAHGLLVWFDSVLVEGVSLTNRPNAPELLYGRAFFPWQEPVALEVGEVVSVQLSASKSGDDYIWSWRTQVLRPGAEKQPKADFKQSSLWGWLFSPARMRKGLSDHLPTLNADGQVEQFILALMNGETAVREIAELAWQRFPNYFADQSDALTRVSELARNFSQ